MPAFACKGAGSLQQQGCVLFPSQLGRRQGAQQGQEEVQLGRAPRRHEVLLQGRQQFGRGHSFRSHGWLWGLEGCREA